MPRDGCMDDTRTFSRSEIHDLKNRLTVVKGMTQLLGRQVQRDEWDRDRIILRVDNLQDEIRKLEMMIDGLRQPSPSVAESTSRSSGKLGSNDVSESESAFTL